MGNVPSHRNRSANVHQFAMIPKAEIPRSTFLAEHTHKTTFDAGYLIPVYVDEVLPGDHHRCQMTAFARLSTPIYPVMDNMYLDSFFFFVPNRLVWENWQKFMGEQLDPTSSIDYEMPIINLATSVEGDISDYFGLPIGIDFDVISLPYRCYNRIWQEWFRDQNMQSQAVLAVDDAEDTYSWYPLRRRGKRHDYFTSCLPWPQKGASAVTLPLSGLAPVTGLGYPSSDTTPFPQADISVWETEGTAPVVYPFSRGFLDASNTFMRGEANADDARPEIYADLSMATGATINALRSAFAIQRLLERDARGGTRYTESVRVQFGVTSPDARLQRPEYIGGGSSPVNISPIAQQSATAIDGSDTPMGTLAGAGAAIAQHGFTYAATEHGYIIGLVSVRADLTYQEGVERMWTRSTRYDFYTPAFAHLGEQAVLRREIYAVGTPALDETVFGYQERWGELRYARSKITGKFRSAATGTLDAWHLAQYFDASPPVLGDTFIVENPPVDRVVAVSTEPHFLADMLFSCKKTRAMPMYSVPGLIDHF